MRFTHYCHFTRLPAFLCVVLLSGSLASCLSSKKTTYFQELDKDTTLNNLVSRPPETAIQRGDLLSITVASLSPENTAIYNVAPDALNGLQGYLVDTAGNIQFLKLGTLHAAGLTKTALKTLLEQRLEPYLAQNVVTVGIQNRHITLMGALSPQILPLTENMTILDALAASGDIGAKGKTDNILVIREHDAGREKTFKRLNLTNKSVFYSPYFYMQPNDVVYVEPAKEKAKIISIVSIVVSTTSFVLLLIDRIFK